MTIGWILWYLFCFILFLLIVFYKQINEKFDNRIARKRMKKDDFWEKKFYSIWYGAMDFHGIKDKSNGELDCLYQKQKKQKLEKQRIKQENLKQQEKYDNQKIKLYNITNRIHKEEEKIQKLLIVNDISLWKNWLYEYEYTFFSNFLNLIEEWNIKYTQLITNTLECIMDFKVFDIDELLDDNYWKIQFYSDNLSDIVKKMWISDITLKSLDKDKERVLTILDNIQWIIEKDKIKERIKSLINNYNNWIKSIKNGYVEWKQNSIEKYFGLMLDSTIYDYFFTKKFEIEYSKENKILIINYELPDVDNFPKLKEIKELKSWEQREVFFSKKMLNEVYEKYIFSMCIRIIYEICFNDKKEHIDAVVFNGYVNTINRATWHSEIFYTISLQAKRDEILDLNLEYIDAKTTFKNLKWVSANKISSLTPIKPILAMDKNDKRIAEWYNVIDGIDTTTNLAAMDRQDFENLIRDLFEKIYSKNWWEVKVTQASKDWWIDAIAFDPDPITWWKTVIQAKRYTNIVWVSAVRDLYGTVMNEWAMKWILVTTSNFWSDSYSFVKDKPISLITWANLLHLLEEHW